MRKSRKLIAILAVLALLVTMLPVGTAFAAGEYKALQVPTVNDDKVQELGTVKVDITPGSIKPGDSVTFRLPEDFQFVYDKDGDGKAEQDEVMGQAQWNDAVVSSSVYADYPNFIEVPERYAGDDNCLSADDVKVTYLDENEIKITVNNIENPGADGIYLFLHLGAVYIDSGFDGDVKLVADAPSGSGFPDGTVVVGRVSSEGKVSLEVTNVPSFSNDTTGDPIKIRIKEDVSGALEKDTESLKLVLPSGFEWMTTDINVNLVWGGWRDTDGDGKADDVEVSTDKNDVGDSDFDLVIYPDDDELIIAVNNESLEAACIELTLNIEVEDETDAQPGDVTVKVRGESDCDQSEIVVAEYGEYETSISVKDVPTVMAGMTEQEIGDIVIKESVKGSLVSGRTIILTLPSNAKWGKIDEDSDSGVDLEFAGFPGTDGRSAKWKVDGESTEAAELELEDMEVVLEPGFTGDLVIEVSGTAGLSGEITVAKVVTPVTITADNVPEVKIGTVSDAGDLTITETVDGAIKDDKDLVIDLPEGVRFASTPKVEVVEGDLDIDEGGVRTKADGGTDDNWLVIPIDGKSSEPSTIKVTGIQYICDRTVPEGDIVVKVKGAAVAEVNDLEEVRDYYGDPNLDAYDKVEIDGFEAFQLGEDGKIFPKTSTAAKTVNAKVTTPAPGEQKATVVFKVGDTKFTVNGAEQTMDVAPYIKNGRTYIPVRYSAQAVGVAPENILFSGGKVTLIKGDKVVQFTIGSNVMLVNGVGVTMDVKAEITNGRTMLPFRWVAQALGAQVNWDPTEQTVTMTL